jgi:hypothetical protein
MRVEYAILGTTGRRDSRVYIQYITQQTLVMMVVLLMMKVI